MSIDATLSTPQAGGYRFPDPLRRQRHQLELRRAAAAGRHIRRGLTHAGLDDLAGDTDRCPAQPRRRGDLGPSGRCGTLPQPTPPVPSNRPPG